MASVELPYYCHHCRTRVQPINANGSDTEDVMCPHCQGGFIEKIEENNSNPNEQFLENPTAAASNESFNQFDLNTVFFPRNHANGSFPNFDTWTLNSRGSEPSSSRNDNGGATSSSAPYNLRQRPNRTGSSNSIGSRRPFADHDLIHDVVRRVFGGVDPPFVEFSLGGGNLPAFNFMELHGNTGDYAWGPNGLDNIISQLLGQLENAGPPPASKDAISKLPKFKVSQEDVDNAKECTVCMDLFKVDETAKKLPCNHTFHIGCIDPWLDLHNTCPICRKVVEDKSCDPHSSTNNPHVSASQNAPPPGTHGSRGNNSTDPGNEQSSFFSLFSFLNPGSNSHDPQS